MKRTTKNHVTECLIRGGVQLAAAWLLYQQELVRIRPPRGLTVKVLLHPTDAPWRTILEFGEDHHFLDSVGMDSFYGILGEITPHFNKRRSSKGKRKKTRLVTAADALGLVLFWLTGTMRMKTLSKVFGHVPSMCSKMKTKGMEALDLALDEIPDSQVRWPTHSHTLT